MPPRVQSPTPVRHHLKAWRKHKGLTLAQVAEAIGSTKGHLSNVENYVTSLTPAVAESIARVLEIEMSLIFRFAPGEEVDQEQLLISIFRSASPEAKLAIMISVRAIAQLGRVDPV